jgi:hypothetical protein
MIKEAFMKGFVQKLLGTGTSSLSKRVRVGYRKQVGHGGPSSFVMWLPLEAASRLPSGVGRKIKRGWQNLELRALDADMIAGGVPHAITKHLPLVKNLFIQKDLVPYGKGMLKEVERTSLMAPMAKAMEIASPIIVGVEADKALNKWKKDKDEHGQKATL